MLPPPTSVGALKRRCSCILPGIGRLGCLAMDAVSTQRLEGRLACRPTQPCHSAGCGEQARASFRRHLSSDIAGQPWNSVVCRMAASSFPSLSSPTLPHTAVVAATAGQPLIGADSKYAAGGSTLSAVHRHSALWWQERMPCRSPKQRHFRVLPPVMMGRRAAKIATRKGAQDAKRAKQYGKLGKQIVSAVKQGGSTNPATNSMLAAALAFAKQVGAPKDLIDRNLKRASDKGQADFSEIVYEVYGLGGVGIVVEALSDNNARAAATVRDVVKKAGAKMADSGSVLFNFKRCAVIAVPAETADADDLMLAAMDAGADDVLEPAPEDAEHQDGPSVFKVVTSPETYTSVRAALEEGGVQINSELSGLELIPVAFVEADDEARDLNDLLMEKLLELDDVDAVFSNQKEGP